MEINQKSGVYKLTLMAMLAAISTVLILLIRFPIFPAAPYLIYDMADVPVLIGTVALGPLPGLVILLVASTIQAFALSSDGWVGLVMHLCASGALVLVSGLIYKRYQTTTSLMIGLALGSLAWTVLMVPLNFILTVHAYGVPFEVVRDAMLPFTIPFNLIKSSANSVITLLIIAPLGRFIKPRRLENG